ncbi:MAG: hypothetical protein V3T63_04165 [Nitrosopumilaceae archaeon]
MKIGFKVIIVYTTANNMDHKGWWVGMAIAVAVVWTGINYLLPWY